MNDRRKMAVSGPLRKATLWLGDGRGGRAAAGAPAGAPEAFGRFPRTQELHLLVASLWVDTGSLPFKEQLRKDQISNIVESLNWGKDRGKKDSEERFPRCTELTREDFCSW